MGSTLESLIGPLAKIRLELMYTQLSIKTDQHFAKLCLNPYNIPFHFTKMLWGCLMCCRTLGIERVSGG